VESVRATFVYGGALPHDGACVLGPLGSFSHAVFVFIFMPPR